MPRQVPEMRPTGYRWLQPVWLQPALFIKPTTALWESLLGSTPISCPHTAQRYQIWCSCLPWSLTTFVCGRLTSRQRPRFLSISMPLYIVSGFVF